MTNEEIEALTQVYIVRDAECSLPNDTTVESEWVEQGYQGCTSYCKRCGKRALYNNHGDMEFSNYCPRCGAKMYLK